MKKLLHLSKLNKANATNAERKLWSILRSAQMGSSFRRQHQIGNYIVDFICLKEKLIIECDGGQHNPEVDKERTDFLQKEGYRIIRFWNNEVLNNIEGVFVMIKKSLNENKLHPLPTSPLKGEGKNLTALLLAWYAANGRDMPWRVKGGAHSDAYAVWISEIMLQQTTVASVIDYFNRWMRRFPTIHSVADADIHDVLLMWQGLGYYTRARKIHECARVLVRDYGGVIPNDRDTLLKLPGIGPYTASSICAFAFNKPETVVDGNVIRVIARLYGLTHAVTKDEIYARAEKLTSQKHGADYASAIMDLGATVCTPANPKCSVCPWEKFCVAHARGLTAEIPLIQKPEKKKRAGTVYLIQNARGAYLIQKRTEKGLLFGLYEFPWSYDDTSPFASDWQTLPKKLTHVFTHFHLTLSVKKTTVKSTVPKVAFPMAVWVKPSEFKNYPFSTLMKKVQKLT